MAVASQYHRIIRKPVVTEKSTVLQDIRNQFTFRVHRDANKSEIAKAVEALFNVHVVQVNIIRVPGKIRRIVGQQARTRPWKKALVKLRAGERIDFA